MSVVISEATVECRSDVCSLWTVITDTERLNRAVGMDRITLSPISDTSAARYLVSTHLGGLPVQYEERPFEWLYPRRFKLLRKMRSGPLELLEMAYALDPRNDGGTNVKITLTLTPRYGILTPFIRFNAGLTLRTFKAAILKIDAALASGEERIAPARKSRAHEAALDRAATALRSDPERPVVAELADKIVAYVRDESDADVSRIRPFALADEWSVDRRALLATCLAAVRAGLLELRWEIICPSCRTATDTLPSLASLADHGACQLCEIEFALDLDEAVEATFGPAKAVREVDVGPYCIGGPARTPHVIEQVVVPPDGRVTLAGPEEEGHYRLFVRGGAATPVDVKPSAPAEVRVDSALLPKLTEAASDAPPTSTKAVQAAIAIAPGGVLHVHNTSSEERHAKIERMTWVDQAARARVVTAMPGFRRDFSNDILRPGMALRVARLGIFFSDLTGSTQLYSNAGDAAAFKLVHDHFDVVIGLIEKNKGTLVKTIGDAVMAVFTDDFDGLVASVAMLHAFDEFRKGGDYRDQTHIKLGVFAGSCYVVTANGVLDYFGQTANIAARLQAEAKSGELVVEECLADRAIAEKAIPESFVVERYDAKLKGVPRPIRVARIRVG